MVLAGGGAYAAYGTGVTAVVNATTIGPAHADGAVGIPDPNKALVTFYDGLNAFSDTAFMIAAFC